jgi:hypothetical protein
MPFFRPAVSIDAFERFGHLFVVFRDALQDYAGLRLPIEFSGGPQRLGVFSIFRGKEKLFAHNFGRRVKRPRSRYQPLLTPEIRQRSGSKVPFVT